MTREFQDYRVMTWDWRFTFVSSRAEERRLYAKLKREGVRAAFKALSSPGWTDIECIYGNEDPAAFLAMGVMEGMLRAVNGRLYSDNRCGSFDI